MSRAHDRQPSGRSRGRRPALTPYRITMLVLTALAVVLIVENRDEIAIRLVVPIVTMPLYLALLIMFVLGGLCGALLIRSRGR
ncbi:LapA family protein [Streptomyces sp. ODS05-4]|uniref:LapA family protein n=1 Tax=Streptomyces sp. ODS05-4 TaxID=2944939 RepID=UPI00210F16FD|nr:LapA family protein [Streptomyces sp. ODS05-4]